jgi:hypothetical protein
MKRAKHLLTSLAVLALHGIALPAMAWGPNGHAIVADIAAAHLSDPTRQQVLQLLGAEDSTSLDQIASWADSYRATHSESGPWHFVDIPLTAQGFDEERDCAGGNCVVDKIVAFAQVLADRSAPAAQRAQALNFLVHFVADIHQPLHCEDNGDRGGNDIKVSFFGKPTNLHAIWDDAILEHATGLRTLVLNYRIDRDAARAEAEQLDRAIVPEQAARWAPPGLVEHLKDAAVAWATESHQLARAVYAETLGSTRLDDGYETKEWPVVQIQLERAGRRLAELLNEILKQPDDSR